MTTWNVLVCSLVVAVGQMAFEAPSALASDLMAPFDFESTAVLPKGVRNPRFKDIVEYVDQKYGGSWGSEAISYPMNKQITWQDVIDGQPDQALKDLTKAKMQQLGYSTTDIAGQTAGVASIYMNAKVPVFAAGLTDKLTLAVAIPVVSIQFNADTGLRKTDQGQAFMNSICQTQPDMCDKATDDFNNATNTKLKRLGYNQIESFDKTQLGDVKIVGKYRLWSDDMNGVALKTELITPTGTPPNADNAVDTPTGDGQFSVGETVVYDRWVDRQKSTRANFYAGYRWSLPDSLDRRIPTSGTDVLSADKENVSRKRGDVISAGASLNYEFTFGLTAGLGYNFQRMNVTDFTGSRFPQYRYDYLSATTGGVSETLHSATLGLGFSSVEMYKRHAFKLPFQLNAAYSIPLAGMNVVKNDLMEFEVVLFF